jgi:porphobilinogen deaminase
MPAKDDPRFSVKYFAEDEFTDNKLILNSNKDLYIFRDEIDISKISKLGEPKNLSGLRVGTSSLRRKMQAKLFYGADTVLDIRGNVDTRMEKLFDNQFDCIILAEQGLRRLGVYKNDLNSLVSSKLPAIGQGVVCLQYRADDAETREVIDEIFTHSQRFDSELYIDIAEAQHFVSALGADCNSAIAIQVVHGYDWNGFMDLNLQAEVYGKDSFIRVASHDENGHILEKYKTDERLTGAGERTVITNILIEEAIEKGALDLLNEHN